MVLQEREKNLGFIVALVCLGLSYIGLNSQISKKNQRASDELAAAEERLTQAKDILKTANEQLTPTEKPAETETKKVVWLEPERRPTLSILRDITAKGESEGLKIVSTESSGGGVFKLVLQAPFANLVRYISFLERTDGGFVVTGAGFQKVDVQADGVTNKELLATLNLKMKG